MQVFIRSAEQNWNIGGSNDEVWNGWRHVQSEDNFWGCGNNIGLTLQKGMSACLYRLHYVSYLFKSPIVDDMKCTYGASYYNPSFSLIKLNGKPASGSFAYDRSKSKVEVYNAFTEFIESQIAAQNAENIAIPPT
ncbi:unnamed protein product [Rotaria sordida]|uniref:Uncharacterized protein n=1 Tax=Rotaria sordida TaxID=392033 RepID=A0A814HWD6_9BILA|nr:unnamed protein product [Rotaria sordida]CAF1015484.1 unnamed protein product [Rotaria sordida]CAF3860366.1 unnamed protein product [Rotaria sordida]